MLAESRGTKMIKKRVIETIFIVFLALLVNLCPMRSYSQEVLNKIQQEIADLKKEIGVYEQYEESLLNTMGKYQLEVKLKEKEVQAYNIQISQLEQNINLINSTIQGLEIDIKTAEDYIKRRLVFTYKMGTLGYYRMLLYPQNSSMLVRSYQLVSILSRKDQSVITDYQEKKDALFVEQNQLLQKQLALSKAKAGIEGTKHELAIKMKEQKILLSGIQEQKELYIKAVNELQISAKKLENFIEGLENKQEFFESLPDIHSFKGILTWPMQGRILKAFGKQKHEKFHTYVFHKGIEIEAKEGNEVTAVFDGKVVYTEWFEGYGKMVIIEHRDHVYTIYAHNSKTLVKQGDIVHSGQVIALAGSTGSLEGDSLYFEIRQGTDPVNPLVWLKKPNRIIVPRQETNPSPE